jgi:hypothetical protein
MYVQLLYPIEMTPIYRVRKAIQPVLHTSPCTSDTLRVCHRPDRTRTCAVQDAVRPSQTLDRVEDDRTS